MDRFLPRPHFLLSSQSDKRIRDLEARATSLESNTASLKTRMTNAENKFGSYYTAAQVNTAFGGYYTKSEIDEKLAEEEEGEAGKLGDFVLTSYGVETTYASFDNCQQQDYAKMYTGKACIKNNYGRYVPKHNALYWTVSGTYSGPDERHFGCTSDGKEFIMIAAGRPYGSSSGVCYFN